MAKKKSPARKKAGELDDPSEPEPSGASENYTPDRVRKVADHLRLVASEFDGLAKSMEDVRLGGAGMRDKMLRRSMLHITNFGDQLRRIIREVQGMDF